MAERLAAVDVWVLGVNVESIQVRVLGETMWVQAREAVRRKAALLIGKRARLSWNGSEVANVEAGDDEA